MPALLRFAAVLVALLLAFSVSPARAEPEAPAAYGAPEPPAEAHFGGQRNFGFGPTLGLMTGAGGLFGGGGELIKAWVSGGYMPVLIFANEHETKAFRYNGFNAAQVNSDITVRIVHHDRADVSLLGGYKYNTILGNGGGGGLLVQYDLGPRLAIVGMVGVSVFPSAKDHLVNDHGYPTDRDPSLPWLQGGLNGALVIFP